MAWENTGRISVSSGGTTVTGSGTQFTVGARVGDGLVGPDGKLYEITNVVSNTSLTITPEYGGSSASNQTYKIVPVRGYSKLAADRLQDVLPAVQQAEGIEDWMSPFDKLEAQKAIGDLAPISGGIPRADGAGKLDEEWFSDVFVRLGEDNLVPIEDLKASIQAAADTLVLTDGDGKIHSSRLDIGNIAEAIVATFSSKVRDILGRSTAAEIREDIEAVGKPDVLTDEVFDVETPSETKVVSEKRHVFGILDGYRRSVEAGSGGRNTVIYTAKGQPSVMYVQPRFHLEDIPGWDSDFGTGVHPAFDKGSGADLTEIFISKYLNRTVNSEAISMSGVDPSASISQIDSIALCQANGAGWDLMGVWDWSAVAMMTEVSGHDPMGNTEYGRSNENRDQTGILVAAGDTIGDSSGGGYTLTGSGPAAWTHDGTAEGIDDIVGNKIDWLSGMYLQDGKAYIAQRGGVSNEAQFLDTGYTYPTGNVSTRTGWQTKDYGTVPSASSVEGKLLRQALLMPGAGLTPKGGLFVNVDGKRAALRGGTRGNGSRFGVAYLNLRLTPTSPSSSVGFRAVFRNL